MVQIQGGSWMVQVDCGLVHVGGRVVLGDGSLVQGGDGGEQDLVQDGDFQLIHHSDM